MSLTKQHDSERCEDVDGQPCEMCRWADEVEKRHAAELTTPPDLISVSLTKAELEMVSFAIGYASTYYPLDDFSLKILGCAGDKLRLE